MKPRNWKCHVGKILNSRTVLHVTVLHPRCCASHVLYFYTSSYCCAHTLCAWKYRAERLCFSSWVPSLRSIKPRFEGSPRLSINDRGISEEGEPLMVEDRATTGWIQGTCELGCFGDFTKVMALSLGLRLHLASFFFSLQVLLCYSLCWCYFPCFRTDLAFSMWRLTILAFASSKQSGLAMIHDFVTGV